VITSHKNRGGRPTGGCRDPTRHGGHSGRGSRSWPRGGSRSGSGGMSSCCRSGGRFGSQSPSWRYPSLLGAPSWTWSCPTPNHGSCGHNHPCDARPGSDMSRFRHRSRATDSWLQLRPLRQELPTRLGLRSSLLFGSSSFSPSSCFPSPASPSVHLTGVQPASPSCADHVQFLVGLSPLAGAVVAPHRWGSHRGAISRAEGFPCQRPLASPG
jgi:hypothetical protein